MALPLSGLELLGLRGPTLSIGKVWERRVRCCLASKSLLSVVRPCERAVCGEPL